ncbi:MAG: sigma-70 family RNA polymerase sigma factor [Oscillospiraceae bacterium]
MTTINLKDFYYWYLTDEPVVVSEAVAAELLAGKRYEPTHQRRLTRNKAQYSLDAGDGIENAACEFEPSAQDILDRKEDFERLCRALNSLPEAQGRRIDACIILGKSCREVAQAEGVDEESVRQSIKRGLDNMRKNF